MNINTEIANALKNNQPVVALESTIIAHGLPKPDNFRVAQEIEQVVRNAGAIPATIAVIDGEICVGLNSEQLSHIANDENILKLGIRDIAHCVSRKISGATTVASTSWIANQCGISTFATGDSWCIRAKRKGVTAFPVIDFSLANRNPLSNIDFSSFGSNSSSLLIG